MKNVILEAAANAYYEGLTAYITKEGNGFGYELNHDGLTDTIEMGGKNVVAVIKPRSGMDFESLEDAWVQVDLDDENGRFDIHVG